MKREDELWMYKYIVEAYIEDISDKNFIESGIVCATTYVDAMKKLVDFYDEEAIVEVKCLMPWDANDIITKAEIENMEL
mgnify:CR=1 FL=1